MSVLWFVETKILRRCHEKRKIRKRPVKVLPGQNDWFAQVLEQEGQRGRGVRQGVSAVQDNKAVGVVVVFFDVFCNLE